MYADELDKKYAHATRDTSAETSRDEQVYQTSEGPALIVTSGKDVFISESYDLPTARKLEALMLGAQNLTEARLDSRRNPPASDLAGNMVRFMAGCGLMKAALPHHLY
jgi:hypothetical protein